MSENLRVVLTDIINNIKNDLKDKVLLDNDTENELVDAYNEGVEAMSCQTVYYLRKLMFEMGVKQDG